jgi:hypothetical protein
MLVPFFHKVQLVAKVKVKEVSSSVQRKYDKVYFIPEKVDGVSAKQKSTVRQFMQLTELVTKLMWW